MPVRILHVEDSETDAEIIKRELKRGGVQAEVLVVQSEPDFRRALAELRPHLILSDFELPAFNGARALTLARELAPEVPFIFVSGTMGEEHAVNCLKNGATDYVLKGNLVRLPAAMTQALAQAEERKTLHRAERALLESATGLRRAQVMAGLAHVITGAEGAFESWSDNLPLLLGLTDTEMPVNTHQWLDLVHPDDRERFRSASIDAARSGTRAEFDYRLRHRDGAWLHLRQVSEPIGGADGGEPAQRWFGTLQDVTAERQAAIALQASETRYRSTFEQAAVGIVQATLEGDIQMVNETFCEMAGYARAEAIQLHIRDVTHPEDFAHSAEGRERVLGGVGSPYQREMRLRRKDGSDLWTSVTTSAIRDPGGKPLHFVSVLGDISERKRAEAALIEGERNFRALFEANPHPMWMYDPETFRFVAVNDAAVAHYGYSRGEFLCMTIGDIRPASDVARLVHSGAHEEHRGFIESGSWTHRRKDGSLIEVEITSHASELGGRRVRVVRADDVTERRRAERDLQRFRAAMDITIDSIYLTDPETMRFLYVNDTACKRLGYTREELLSKTSFEVVGKSRTEIEREYAEVIAAGDNGTSSESRFVRKDGSAGWTELHRRALKIDDKTLIVTLGRDITDRKRAALELAESEGRFRSLTKLSSDWFWQTDAEHRFIDTPDRVTQLTGMRANAYVGKRRWEVEGLVPVSGDWSAHKAALERRESYRDLELVQTKKDGARLFLQVSGEPVYDASGVFTGYRGTAKDITAQKRDEEKLRRFRLAMDGSADIILLIDRATMKHVDCNETACRLLGYSREELLGMGPADTLPVGREELERTYDELINSRAPASGMNSYYRCKDGSRLPFESTRRVLRSGDTWLIVAVSRDMRERLAAENALRESEARFRSLTELSSDFYWETDTEHRVTRAEHGGGGHHPVVDPGQIGKARWEKPSVFPDAAGWAAHRAALESHQPFRDFEIARRGHDGELRWRSLSGEPVFDQGGAFKGYRGIGRDITASKRGEEELRRFRLAMDSSADIIIITDRATMRHVDVNQTACRLLGYSREELLRLGPPDILPVTSEELAARYDELIANPSLPSGMHSFYRCKDGSRLPFESTRQLLRAGDRWIVVAISRDIRERLASEQARREAEERFRSIFENAAEGIYQVSPEGRLLAANPAVARMLGFESPEEALATVTDLSTLYVDLDDRRRLRERLDANGIVHGFQTRLRRKDDHVIWASISVRIIRDRKGEISHVLGMMQDVTERNAQQRRIERLTRVYALLSGINAAIVRIRDRDELYREACRIAVEQGGFRMAWAGVIGRDRERIEPVAWQGADTAYIRSMPLELKESGGGRPSLSAMAVRARQPVVSDDMASDPRIVLRAEAGKRGFHSLAILPLTEENEIAGVLALYATEVGFFDADEMKLLNELAGDVSFALDVIAKEERINYLALHDPLTGLANRTLFAERLRQSMTDIGDLGGKLALVSLDLERLTTINESLGRQAGDALIKRVAERLAAAAGAAGAARIAADNFVAVLSSLKGRSHAARKVTELLRACFAEPYVIEGNELRVAAKAGLALFPNDGADAETLLGNAEAALRKAKETGERHVFYTPGLTERDGASLTLENKLRRALEKDEFVLHYQPKVDADGRSIVGMEALIRWQSPELGLVPPGKFIPLMEETGMILDVGTWALRRVSLDHRRWTEMNLRPPRVAVNVSAIQLRQKDFVKAVEEAIMEGVAPTGIDLEITESLVMEDIEGNIGKLREVRALGVGLAIDDFGTGYSSLSYLAKLPVQTLKIDRSFVITMLNEPDTITLVQTVISLAHSLRLKVVAEGVEAEEQAKVLRLLRCDQMQGYLFSRPVPFDEICKLLAFGG